MQETGKESCFALISELTLSLMLVLAPSASEEAGAKIIPSAQNASDSVEESKYNDWRRSLLHRLKGLPLIPVGTGPRGRAPNDPVIVHPIDGWQSADHRPDQISAMPELGLPAGRCGP